jgi:hypothetical protein
LVVGSGLAFPISSSSAVLSGPSPKFVSTRVTFRYESKDNWQLYDSIAPFELEVRDRICRAVCANFGFGALALLWQIFAADERDGIPKSVFQ